MVHGPGARRPQASHGRPSRQEARALLTADTTGGRTPRSLVMSPLSPRRQPAGFRPRGTEPVTPSHAGGSVGHGGAIASARDGELAERPSGATFGTPCRTRADPR